MDGPTHLVVGLLKKPHGVRGDALIYPVTDEPDAVFALGKRLTLLDREGRATGRELVIERSRPYHRAWLLHFEGRHRQGFSQRHRSIETDTFNTACPAEITIAFRQSTSQPVTQSNSQRASANSGYF